MSAPPRVIYMDKFSVVDCLKDIGGDWEYILKSDYDELQNQVDRAFSMLEANGVPRTRAKYVSNGIDVLATRFSKQVNELQQSNIHNAGGNATPVRAVAVEGTVRHGG